MKKSNQQTVFCKEDFKWHYISFYLDSMKSSVPIDDEQFCKLFQRLQDYVETKLFISDEGDLEDMYVIVERIIK